MVEDRKVLSSKNSRISRKKPEIMQKPKPDIIWNDKDIQAYKDIEVDVPTSLLKWELNFLNNVDISSEAKI
jgi:hypothetical protein